jgi:hypothetical protein
MKQTIKKLSENPNCIEMYKQQKYYLAEENTQFILFRKKYNFFHHLGWTILLFWLSLILYNNTIISLIMFVLYPILQHYTTIKVLKNE